MTLAKLYNLILNMYTTIGLSILNVLNILTDLNYATCTSLYIFQKTVECKINFASMMSS